MNKGVKHLSQSINPKTVGVIWLTDDKIEIDSPGVYEFNYLLNGIVVKSIEQTQGLSQNQNYFIGSSFDHPIFVAHLKVQRKDDLKNIYNQIEISKTFIPEEAEIFIFNKSQNTANLNVLKTLSEKYPQIKFENLNI